MIFPIVFRTTTDPDDLLVSPSIVLSQQFELQAPKPLSLIRIEFNYPLWMSNGGGDLKTVLPDGVACFITGLTPRFTAVSDMLPLTSIWATDYSWNWNPNSVPFVAIDYGAFTATAGNLISATFRASWTLPTGFTTNAGTSSRFFSFYFAD